MSEIDWDKAPEGATHYRPGCHKYIPHWVKVEGEYRYMSRLERPDAFIHDHTPRPLSECIPRPSPAWSGEGLPPVGVVCEVKLQEEWHLCEIIGHFQQPQEMVAAFTVGQFHGGKKLDSKISESFRPIRTPEQIAADEREAAILQMLADASRPDTAKTRDQAQLLYDAGWRKQPKP